VRLLLVVTVMVELPEPVTELGLKLALAPDGNPLTLKLTCPPNPPEDCTVTLEVVLLPWVTGEGEKGLAAMEKSGGAVGVAETSSEEFALSPTALTAQTT